MSPTHQHNLYMTYLEALAKSSKAERSDAFARFVCGLSEEELAYIDHLISRDLCEALTRSKG